MPKSTFVSYVDAIDNYEDEEHEASSRRESARNLSITGPNLLEAEEVCFTARNVTRFDSLQEQTQGIIGSLYITTLRISFIPLLPSEDSAQNRSGVKFLDGPCEITIGCIRAIDTDYKDKKLGANRGMRIICKDFRCELFTFDLIKKEEELEVINAIKLMMSPKEITSRFAFKYLEEPASNRLNHDIPLFDKLVDWEQEIAFLTGVDRSTGVRVTHANESLSLCDSLPMLFAVPANILDNILNSVSQKSTQYRVLTWCYSHRNNSMLVRTPHFMDDASSSPTENEVISKLHSSGPVEIIDLSSVLPSTKDVKIAYDTLLNICLPTSYKEFSSTDKDWYSNLEGTKWMYHVVDCLSLAEELARKLDGSQRCLLIKENECRDFCCVISSLVHILARGRYRTIKGFLSLLQREWVVMGHKFQDRLGFSNEPAAEQSPIFLLFLDCVQQLLFRFPTEFEYTEAFLRSLWRLSTMGIFEEFLFNSVKEKIRALDERGKESRRKEPARLRSAWSLHDIFTVDAVNFFNNPLYRQEMHPKDVSTNGTNGSFEQEELLVSNSSVSTSRFWSECYLGYCSPVQISSESDVFLGTSDLVKKVRRLQGALKRRVSQAEVVL